MKTPMTQSFFVQSLRRTLLATMLLAPLAQADNLFIQNGKLYGSDNTGTPISGNVLIRGNRIVAVGAEVKPDADSRIIDAKGRPVTVGLMNAHTGLGTVDIDAEDSTADTATPDLRFGASFDLTDVINPDSVLIPYNRMMGLTRAVVTPAVGHDVFGGQSTLIRLAGDDVVERRQAAVIANYGAHANGANEGSRASTLLAMRMAFDDAKDYTANRAAFQRGERREYSLPYRDLDALLPVLDGRIPLIVAVDRAQDIRAILKLGSEYKLRLILLGASEGHRVAKDIAAAKAAVILAPMENLPDSFDTLSASLSNAAELNRAGVKIAFTSNAGDSPSHNAHLARQGAGNAVANGLPADAALAALTRNPAEMFGISDHYGKLAAGYDADVVVWSDDPLEVTSYPDHVILAGTEQSLVSHQTRLRDRYKEPADPLRAYKR
ncbi:amidohydrolase family protein [Permianibacter sp. IMCC34836]|uniref:amidohydrolase family protein n=1 Tax=Permianibacter fluminis TaxID=2738515 RepID=UPI0015570078|nr:amidohydrolase family protein [Permianibacter fluminis]NQD38817.1 amidohydrolase family protein [Permianibacter fluminis]